MLSLSFYVASPAYQWRKLFSDLHSKKVYVMIFIIFWNFFPQYFLIFLSTNLKWWVFWTINRYIDEIQLSSGSYFISEKRNNLFFESIYHFQEDGGEGTVISGSDEKSIIHNTNFAGFIYNSDNDFAFKQSKFPEMFKFNSQLFFL